jgi:hypothetical protein
VGSVNEACAWNQRRNVLVHWLDDRGELTGLKLEVRIECRQQEERFPYGIWPLQMGLESLALQDGPRVVGALIRADVVPAERGDVLGAPSAYMGIGHEALLVPRNPVAWLLGTHWRQPIEPRDRRAPLEAIEFSFTALGTGVWSREADDLFAFASGPVNALIRAPQPAQVAGDRLVLSRLERLDWDWLGAPAVLLPYALAVGAARPNPPPVTAEEADGRIRIVAGDMEIVRRRIAAPDAVEHPTWHGRIAGREVLPEMPPPTPQPPL